MRDTSASCGISTWDILQMAIKRVLAACSASSTKNPTMGGVTSMPERREEALGFVLSITSLGSDFSAASPQHTGR